MIKTGFQNAYEEWKSYQEAELGRELSMAECNAYVDGWNDAEERLEEFKYILRRIMFEHHEDACKPAWWDKADALLHTEALISGPEMRDKQTEFQKQLHQFKTERKITPQARMQEPSK